MKIAPLIAIAAIALAGANASAEEVKGDEERDNGRRILKEISANVLAKKKFDIAAYRGEKVSFIGGGAPPGATNDLVIEQGFYVRIVMPQEQDLRPHSVWWEVSVRGEILQVYPEQKIIVLEIVAKDWEVIQTG